MATGTAHAQDTSNLPTSEENKTGIRKAAENTRHVISDVPTTLWLIFPMNYQTCSPIDDRQYEIMKEPEHGIAELEFKTGKLLLPKDSANFHCSGKTSPAVAIKYTAKKDYIGTDEFSVLELTPHGIAYQWIAHIIVHKRSKSK
jgi:hypothetical protein